MKKASPYLPLLFSALFLATSSAFAELEKLVEINDAKEGSVSVAPNEDTNKVTFALVTKGNQPLSLTAAFSAPKDSVITWSYLAFPQNKPFQEALQSGRGLMALDLVGNGGKFVKSLTAGASHSNPGDGGGGGNNGGGSGGAYCNGLIPAAYLSYYLALYSQYIGHTATIDELCAYVEESNRNNQGGDDNSGTGTGATPTPTPTTGANTYSVNTSSLMYKDACTANLKYVLVANVDLSKISAEDRAAGFNVTANINAEDYSGGRQFKVKQRGDGKYKVPLLLGSMIGSSAYSSDFHLFTRWSGGKMKNTRGKMKNAAVLPYKKTTYYRGLILGISLPGRNLSGGKATVFVTNKAEAYGVCINAVASNQLYNGYRN